MIKGQQQNYTINNFYFSRVQRPTSQQSQQHSCDQKKPQMSSITKVSDRSHLQINKIVVKKPIFQLPSWERKSQLQQLIINQRPSNQIKLSQPIANTTTRTQRQKISVSPYLNGPRTYKQINKSDTKGSRIKNQQSLINQSNTINLNPPNSDSIQVRQEYKQLSQSLNGSFDLIQRRLKSNQEIQAKQAEEPQKRFNRQLFLDYEYLEQRAKSVADDHKIQQPAAQRIRVQPQVRLMDLDTSYEGYRQDGLRFLTMDSQEENDKVLEKFSLKEFLNSRSMSKIMIEHFMNSLKPEQIQLVDKLIVQRKKMIGNYDIKK